MLPDLGSDSAISSFFLPIVFPIVGLGLIALVALWCSVYERELREHYRVVRELEGTVGTFFRRCHTAGHLPIIEPVLQEHRLMHLLQEPRMPPIYEGRRCSTDEDAKSSAASSASSQVSTGEEAAPVPEEEDLEMSVFMLEDVEVVLSEVCSTSSNVNWENEW